MRNHGLLTCGATIQKAFNTMYQLELSCRSQVDAMASAHRTGNAGPKRTRPHGALYQPGTRRPYGVLEWPTLLRLLAAQQQVPLIRHIGVKLSLDRGSPDRNTTIGSIL
jgi:hypothetical protein